MLSIFRRPRAAFKAAWPEPKYSGSMLEMYSAIKRDLEAGHVLDYNGLPPSGKQAVQALVGNAQARTTLQEGRKVVVNKKPNPFLMLVTAGLKA